jgi:hypothetical protein
MILWGAAVSLGMAQVWQQLNYRIGGPKPLPEQSLVRARCNRVQAFAVFPCG